MLSVDADVTAPVKALDVACPECRHSETVRTRSAFVVLEDEHVGSCGIRGLYYAGTVDDVLDLPPFDIDDQPVSVEAPSVDGYLVDAASWSTWR